MILAMNIIQQHYCPYTLPCSHSNIPDSRPDRPPCHNISIPRARSIFFQFTTIPPLSCSLKILPPGPPYLIYSFSSSTCRLHLGRQRNNKHGWQSTNKLTICLLWRRGIIPGFGTHSSRHSLPNGSSVNACFQEWPMTRSPLNKRSCLWPQ